MKTKAQKAVESFINEMISKFVGTRFRYEILEYQNSHIIEVTPYETYKNNMEYRECEIDFIEKFEEKFGESILFVSTESLTKVANPIYENVIEEPEFTFSKEVIPKNILFDYIRETVNCENNVFSIISHGINSSDYLSISSGEVNNMQLS